MVSVFVCCLILKICIGIGKVKIFKINSRWIGLFLLAGYIYQSHTWQTILCTRNVWKVVNLYNLKLDQSKIICAGNLSATQAHLWLQKQSLCNMGIVRGSRQTRQEEPTQTDEKARYWLGARLKFGNLLIKPCNIGCQIYSFIGNLQPGKKQYGCLSVCLSINRHFSGSLKMVKFSHVNLNT